MDDLTPEQRHKVMSRIRSTDTKPEVLLRKRLWALGYRYRKNYRGLPGKPDIVMTKYRIAIFIDSEYFHGKEWDTQREKIASGSNPDYWIPKIERNIQRDREVDTSLNGLGWRVIRFWSRDVLKDPGPCISVIEDAIVGVKLNTFS